MTTRDNVTPIRPALPNLNAAKLRTSSDWTEEPGLSDGHRIVNGTSVEIHFRRIQPALLRFIQTYDYIVGCVAWMTSESVLSALSTRLGVSIIVQKEDFLRPDGPDDPTWRGRLRNSYNRLPQCLERYDFPHPLGGMSMCGDLTVDSVRCVGNHNADKAPSHPRMHHKFIVGCDIDSSGPDKWGHKLSPRAVWTGSCNFTETAPLSLENAVVIRDASIASAYLHEFAQVAALSEPLDWESTWMAPEWRLGT